jgi:hypothetical protein
VVQDPGTFPCIVPTLLAAIEMKCAVCTNVLDIYGTLESIAPWLCECEEESAAQSSQQQTKLFEVKPRIRIRPLVPKIGADLRKRWLKAKYVRKPNNE